MRGYEMVPRGRARVVIGVTLAAVGMLLVFASTAGAAEPSGGPLRQWSVRKILQGPGRVEVSSGAQADGALEQTLDTGRVAFNLRGTPSFDHASGYVFSSATGHSYGVEATAPSRDFSRPQSARGTATHLDEYQAYVKSADNASLKMATTSPTRSSSTRRAGSSWPAARPAGPSSTSGSRVTTPTAPCTRAPATAA